MTYNLTQIYSGGPIEIFNGLNVQSNFILLDGLLIALFIIIVVAMNARASSTKTSVFLASTASTVVSALISFAMAAIGYSTTVLTSYSTRTLVWFAIASLCLLWNVLGDAT